MLRIGFRDGLILAATILGSILTVGTMALLLARETPLFTIAGQPLVPVLSALGLPDADIIAPAVLVGITEMYIPALLVQDAATPARFFIAVLSISQLIFFSSVGPMILDMFREVPVRARELVALFIMRTAILVPLLAAVTAVFAWMRLLGS
jgi:nucleoside recognition membrane protein YjiH